MKNVKKLLLNLLLVLSTFIGLTQNSHALKKNLHVMDGNKTIKSTPSYTMVRTGKPSFEDFKEMCGYGVRRMFVMSGNGKVEEEYAKTPWALENCQNFKVVYNRKQKVKVPISKEFLAKFDKEIAAGKAGGWGIGFRCNCGCHRTGRIAAYYNMKYLGMSANAAVKDQQKHAPGLLAKLWAKRKLKFQIRALADYIQGKKCKKKKKFCPIEKDPYGVAAGSREDDDLDFAVPGPSASQVPVTASTKP